MDDRSEDEDQPRMVLSPDGEFTNLTIGERFDMPDFKPIGQAAEKYPSARPVPSPSNVARAKTAMGGGRDGFWMGTRFESAQSPSCMFPERNVNALNQTLRRFCIRRRFVSQDLDQKTMLIYTDGNCTSYGKEPEGGNCSFFFNASRLGTHSFALETKGPDGQQHEHTGDRARLRAVVAALQCSCWWEEGWKRIVIASGSYLLVEGATENLRRWGTSNWRDEYDQETEDRDLWELLSRLLGENAEKGCEVSFWWVPWVYIASARPAAYKVARDEMPEMEYRVRKRAVE